MHIIYTVYKYIMFQRDNATPSLDSQEFVQHFNASFQAVSARVRSHTGLN